MGSVSVAEFSPSAAYREISGPAALAVWLASLTPL